MSISEGTNALKKYSSLPSLSASSATSLSLVDDPWKPNSIGIKCISYKPIGFITLTVEVLETYVTDGKHRIDVHYNYTRRQRPDKVRVPFIGTSIENCSFGDTITIDIEAGSTLIDLVLEVQIITLGPTNEREAKYKLKKKAIEERAKSETRIVATALSKYKTNDSDEIQQSVVSTTSSIQNENDEIYQTGTERTLYLVDITKGLDNVKITNSQPLTDQTAIKFHVKDGDESYSYVDRTFKNYYSSESLVEDFLSEDTYAIEDKLRSNLNEIDGSENAQNNSVTANENIANNKRNSGEVVTTVKIELVPHTTYLSDSLSQLNNVQTQFICDKPKLTDDANQICKFTCTYPDINSNKEISFVTNKSDLIVHEKSTETLPLDINTNLNQNETQFVNTIELENDDKSNILHSQTFDDNDLNKFMSLEISTDFIDSDEDEIIQSELANTSSILKNTEFEKPKEIAIEPTEIDELTDNSDVVVSNKEDTSISIKITDKPEIEQKPPSSVKHVELVFPSSSSKSCIDTASNETITTSLSIRVSDDDEETDPVTVKSENAALIVKPITTIQQESFKNKQDNYQENVLKVNVQELSDTHETCEEFNQEDHPQEFTDTSDKQSIQFEDSYEQGDLAIKLQYENVRINKNTINTNESNVENTDENKNNFNIEKPDFTDPVVEIKDLNKSEEFIEESTSKLNESSDSFNISLNTEPNVSVESEDLYERFYASTNNDLNVDAQSTSKDYANESLDSVVLNSSLTSSFGNPKSSENEANDSNESTASQLLDSSINISSEEVSDEITDVSSENIEIQRETTDSSLETTVNISTTEIIVEPENIIKPEIGIFYQNTNDVVDYTNEEEEEIEKEDEAQSNEVTNDTVNSNSYTNQETNNDNSNTVNTTNEPLMQSVISNAQPVSIENVKNRETNKNEDAQSSQSSQEKYVAVDENSYKTKIIVTDVNNNTGDDYEIVEEIPKFISISNMNFIESFLSKDSGVSSMNNTMWNVSTRNETLDHSDIVMYSESEVFVSSIKSSRECLENENDFNDKGSNSNSDYIRHSMSDSIRSPISEYESEKDKTDDLHETNTFQKDQININTDSNRNEFLNLYSSLDGQMTDSCVSKDSGIYSINSSIYKSIDSNVAIDPITEESLLKTPIQEKKFENALEEAAIQYENSSKVTDYDFNTQENSLNESTTSQNEDTTLNTSNKSEIKISKEFYEHIIESIKPVKYNITEPVQSSLSQKTQIINSSKIITITEKSNYTENDQIKRLENNQIQSSSISSSKTLILDEGNKQQFYDNLLKNLQPPSTSETKVNQSNKQDNDETGFSNLLTKLVDQINLINTDTSSDSNQSENEVVDEKICTIMRTLDDSKIKTNEIYQNKELKESTEWKNLITGNDTLSDKIAKQLENINPQISFQTINSEIKNLDTKVQSPQTPKLPNMQSKKPPSSLPPSSLDTSFNSDPSYLSNAEILSDDSSSSFEESVIKLLESKAATMKQQQDNAAQQKQSDFTSLPYTPKQSLLGDVNTSSSNLNDKQDKNNEKSKVDIETKAKTGEEDSKFKQIKEETKTKMRIEPLQPTTSPAEENNQESKIIIPKTPSIQTNKTKKSTKEKIEIQEPEKRNKAKETSNEEPPEIPNEYIDFATTLPKSETAATESQPNLNLIDKSNYQLELVDNDAPYTELVKTTKDIGEFPIYQINKRAVAVQPVQTKSSDKVVSFNECQFDKYTPWNVGFTSDYSKESKPVKNIAIFDSYAVEQLTQAQERPSVSVAQQKPISKPEVKSTEPKAKKESTSVFSWFKSNNNEAPVEKESPIPANEFIDFATTLPKSETAATESQPNLNLIDKSNYQLELVDNDALYTELVKTTKDIGEFPIYQINKRAVAVQPVQTKSSDKVVSFNECQFDKYTPWNVGFTSDYSKESKPVKNIAIFDSYAVEQLTQAQERPSVSVEQQKPISKPEVKSTEPKAKKESTSVFSWFKSNNNEARVEKESPIPANEFIDFATTLPKSETATTESQPNLNLIDKSNYQLELVDNDAPYTVLVKTTKDIGEFPIYQINKRAVAVQPVQTKSSDKVVSFNECQFDKYTPWNVGFTSDYSKESKPVKNIAIFDSYAVEQLTQAQERPSVSVEQQKPISKPEVKSTEPKAKKESTSVFSLFKSNNNEARVEKESPIPANEFIDFATTLPKSETAATESQPNLNLIDKSNYQLELVDNDALYTELVKTTKDIGEFPIYQINKRAVAVQPVQTKSSDKVVSFNECQFDKYTPWNVGFTSDYSKESKPVKNIAIFDSYAVEQLTQAQERPSVSVEQQKPISKPEVKSTEPKAKKESTSVFSWFKSNNNEARVEKESPIPANEFIDFATTLPKSETATTESQPNLNLIDKSNYQLELVDNDAPYTVLVKTTKDIGEFPIYQINKRAVAVQPVQTKSSDKVVSFNECQFDKYTPWNVGFTSDYSKESKPVKNIAIFDSYAVEQLTQAQERPSVSVEQQKPISKPEVKSTEPKAKKESTSVFSWFKSNNNEARVEKESPIPANEFIDFATTLPKSETATTESQPNLNLIDKSNYQLELVDNDAPYTVLVKTTKDIGEFPIYQINKRAVAVQPVQTKSSDKVVSFNECQFDKYTPWNVGFTSDYSKESKPVKNIAIFDSYAVEQLTQAQERPSVSVEQQKPISKPEVKSTEPKAKKESTSVFSWFKSNNNEARVEKESPIPANEFIDFATTLPKSETATTESQPNLNLIDKSNYQLELVDNDAPYTVLVKTTKDIGEFPIYQINKRAVAVQPVQTKSSDKVVSFNECQFDKYTPWNVGFTSDYSKESKPVKNIAIFDSYAVEQLTQAQERPSVSVEQQKPISKPEVKSTEPKAKKESTSVFSWFKSNNNEARVEKESPIPANEFIDFATTLPKSETATTESQPNLNLIDKSNYQLELVDNDAPYTELVKTTKDIGEFPIYQINKRAVAVQPVQTKSSDKVVSFNECQFDKYTPWNVGFTSDYSKESKPVKNIAIFDSYAVEQLTQAQERLSVSVAQQKPISKPEVKSTEPKAKKESTSVFSWFKSNNNEARVEKESPIPANEFIDFATTLPKSETATTESQPNLNLIDKSNYQLELVDNDAPYTELVKTTKDIGEFPIYQINKRAVAVQPVQTKSSDKVVSFNECQFDKYTPWNVGFTSDYSKESKPVKNIAIFDSYAVEQLTQAQERPSVSVAQQKPISKPEVKSTEPKAKKESTSVFSWFKSNNNEARVEKESPIPANEFIDFATTLPKSETATTESQPNLNLIDKSNYQLELVDNDAPYTELVKTTKDIGEFPIYQINKRAVAVQPVQTKSSDKVVSFNECQFDKYTPWNVGFTSDYSKESKPVKNIAIFDSYAVEQLTQAQERPSVSVAQQKPISKPEVKSTEPKAKKESTSVFSWFKSNNNEAPVEKESPIPANEFIDFATTLPKSETATTESQPNLNLIDKSNYQLELVDNDAPYTELVKTTKDIGEFPIYQINKRAVAVQPVQTKSSDKVVSFNECQFDKYAPWNAETYDIELMNFLNQRILSFGDFFHRHEVFNRKPYFDDFGCNVLDDDIYSKYDLSVKKEFISNLSEQGKYDRKFNVASLASVTLGAVLLFSLSVLNS